MKFLYILKGFTDIDKSSVNVTAIIITKLIRKQLKCMVANFSKRQFIDVITYFCKHNNILSWQKI